MNSGEQICLISIPHETKGNNGDTADEHNKFAAIGQIMLRCGLFLLTIKVGLVVAFSSPVVTMIVQHTVPA